MVLSTIVDRAVQLSGADAGTIYVTDSAAPAKFVCGRPRLSEEFIKALEGEGIGFGESTVAQAAALRVPSRSPISRPVARPPFSRSFSAPAIARLLILPLLRAEGVVGALVCGAQGAGRVSRPRDRLLLPTSGIIVRRQALSTRSQNNRIQLAQSMIAMRAAQRAAHTPDHWVDE